MTNVVSLPKPKTTPRPASRKAKRKLHHNMMTASAIGGVAMVLTGLSLNHLASGIASLTHCQGTQSWAMAVGVDIAFVSLELAQLTITDKLRTKLKNYFRPAIIGTLAWSAVLNAMAFANGTSGIIEQGLSIALGLSIPALVYVLTKIGGQMYLDMNH